LRPTATLQEALTARKYDWTRVLVERGVDLLALALLMATLRDWLVICQRIVPVVCEELVWQVILVLEAPYLQTRRKHSGSNDEVGNDEA
jgi:hypothetical protein